MTIAKIIASLCLLGSACVANAASILLTPGSNITDVRAGDLVTFDIVMDFSTDTVGLGIDTTLGGAFNVVFDPNALEFEFLFNAEIGDPLFGRDPDILPGLLESWGFADFDGLTGPSHVGRVVFSVLPAAPASTFVALEMANGLGGPFVSAIDFITIVPVEFNSLEVTVIPVPAAAWFMLSGIGALLVFRRDAKK